MRIPELVSLANGMALRAELRPELVCAVIETESDWNEFAVRMEKAFLSRYIFPMREFQEGKLSPTEAYTRAMSWGLMQVMGQTARELGFRGTYLSELCAPMNSLEYGCKKLAACMKHADGDEAKALLCFNGGGDPEYPARVLEKVKNYKKEAT